MENHTNPTVYTAAESFKPSKKWFKTWKIIYPILGIMVIVELILGFKALLAPLPQSQGQKLLPIKDAKLILVHPTKGLNFKVGDDISVPIRVSTGGHYTSGTDLILRYDPKVLEPAQDFFLLGKIYDSYPLTNIDRKEGVIKVSAVVSAGKKGFNGIGELGIANFTAKAKGDANLTIVFSKPGLTSDSNVFATDEGSKDVLGTVTNLKLNIK